MTRWGSEKPNWRCNRYGRCNNDISEPVDNLTTTKTITTGSSDNACVCYTCFFFLSRQHYELTIRIRDVSETFNWRTRRDRDVEVSRPTDTGWRRWKKMSEGRLETEATSLQYIITVMIVFCWVWTVAAIMSISIYFTELICFRFFHAYP